jgi:hypothetical protein
MSADFAALVLSADDVVLSRRRRRAAARDNVIFELGIAFGALGSGRTFFLLPRDDQPAIFADLAGVEAITYSAPGEKGWVPAMGPAASRIAEAIQAMSPSLTSSLTVNPLEWTQRFPSGPVTTMFLETCADSQRDLVERLRAAERHVNIFGLTRNFFAREDVRDLLLLKARTVPIRLFLMEPTSPARVERYRVEPIEASFEDPARMKREILAPLRLLVAKANAARAGRSAKPAAGIQVYLYNFPCSFAIEEIDDHCRVMLYGHGKRGTEGPIMIFSPGTPYHDYFAGQIRWLEGLASGELTEPWVSKGVRVVPLEA